MASGRQKAKGHHQEGTRVMEWMNQDVTTQGITLDSIADGVIITDSQDRISYMNHVAEKLTAWKYEEAKGRALNKVFVTRMETQSRTGHTKILITKNGTEYLVEDTLTPVQDDNGKGTRSILVFRDITENYRNIQKPLDSEAKLKQNVEELEAIINALPGMVSVVDTEFNVLVANNEVIRIFDQNSPDEVIGKKCYYTRKGLDEPCPQCGVLQAFETKQMVSRVSIPSEEELMGIATKAYAVPLLNDEGEVWGGVEVIMDITDIRNKEKSLRESEERLSLAIQGANLGFWDWNIKTDHLTYNEHWAEIAGYGTGEIEPSMSAWEQMIHRDDLELARDRFDEHQAGLHPFCEYEFRMQQKDGSWKWVSSKGKIVESDDQGSALRAIGILQDITDQKHLENKLKQSNEEYQILNEELSSSIERIKQINTELLKAKEKAEESDRLKMVFLANLSHEIRTPMNGILGFADLLKNNRVSSKVQKTYLTVIEQSGQRMLKLIEDLIDISKIEAGQVEIKYEQTNINQLIDKLFNFFMLQAEQEGLRLIRRKSLANRESNILTDSVKLEQVLSNLINNAFKFTYSGSIDFGYDVSGAELLFWVKDTGKGIPDEMKELIFDRFRQADTSAYRAEEGSGLGLSICKAYVELMGGGNMG